MRTGIREEERVDRGITTTYIERSKGASITEGIGIEHITQNIKRAKIEGAMMVEDIECVEMAYYLKTYDGISVGPSAAMNVVAAVKLAQKLGPGHTIVTILCDTGDRYLEKLYSSKWTIERNLVPEKYKKGRESYTDFVKPIDQTNFT